MKSDPPSSTRRRHLAQTHMINEWNGKLSIVGALLLLLVAPSPCCRWFFTSAFAFAFTFSPTIWSHRRPSAITVLVSSGGPGFLARTTSLSSLATAENTDDRSIPSRDGSRWRVGIAGAGAIALGTAALLNQAGHDPPMIWSPSGRGMAADGLAELKVTGALEQTFPIRTATSAQELVGSNDVVLVALPANGHKTVLDQLALFIRPGQPVIFSSHASMGALYLAGLLRARGVEAPLTAWGTTVVTARREQHDDNDSDNDDSNGTAGSVSFVVRINTIRKAVDGCTIPVDETETYGLGLCRELFPGIDFQQREGLLAISLSNLNPQNHLAMALCNLSRMEKGEAWHQSLYVTPKVGKFMEALDAERLAIASVLGVSVRTIFEHFHLSFHVPLRDNISDMCQDIYHQGRDVYGPATANSRYITEDAPFGLALTVVLGRLVGRPAVLHQSGLAILSAMYERDFYEENDLLKALDLESVDLDLLKQASLTGRLESQRTLV